MSIPDILSGFFPGPLQLLCDMLFTALRHVLGSAGWSVMAMCLILLLPAVPLRRRASGKLSLRRVALSLLLQGCFCAATIRWFSSLQAVRGEAFGLVRDLGAADGLLGGVNLLPLLCGALYLCSALIHTRGAALLHRMLYAAGAVALSVLLYSGPAALSLFWTVCGAGSLILQVTAGKRALSREPAVTGEGKRPEGKKTFLLLLFGCLYLAVFTGLLIPSEILNASPGEFVDTHYYRNPSRYLLSSALTGFGLFALWGMVYGTLLSPRALRRYASLIAVLCGVFALDYAFFSRGFGIISSILRYETAVSNPTGTILLNTAVILAAAAGVILAVRKWPGVVRAVCLYGCAALTVMSVINIVSIEGKAAELRQIAESETQEKPSFRLNRGGKNVVVIMLDRAISGFVPYILNEKPELLQQFDGFTYYPNTLSYGFHTNIAAPALYGGYEYNPDGLESRPDLTLPEKHNEALKIMPVNFLRAGAEVTVCDAPYANYQWIPDLSIYDEYPEIRTFHTIGSFDEYKEEMLRWEDRLRNRNLFCYSLFRTAPALLQQGLYDGGNYLEADADAADRGTHPLYGVSTDFLNSYMVMKNLSAMTEVTEGAGDTFLLLTNEMTHNVIELQEPDYVPARGVDNSAYDAAHPVRTAADGRELNLAGASELLRIHYHSDMAAFLQLGQWFDDLRRQGVYDNTRIILVSDHGCYLGLLGTDLSHGQTGLPEVPGSAPEQWTDTTSYNPLLMVKDFGASGFTTDLSFMTNADIPSLAFEDVVADPVNPFTGRRISGEGKNAEEQHLVESSWDISTNNGAFFSDPVRITFRGRNIFDPEAWSLAK